MIRTIAPQQGHVAAGARSRSVLGGGCQWNAWVAMTMDSHDFAKSAKSATTKYPARHLGGQPT